MPHHHPSEEMLLRYAAGSASEPLGLLVATHMALCPDCRRVHAAYESLGGDELEGQRPSALRSDSLARVLEKLDAPAATAFDVSGQLAVATRRHVDIRLPQPLRDYIAGPLEGLDWRKRGGIAEASVFGDGPDLRVRLMRIEPGTAVPRHGHGGMEYTLVLTGGFSDASGHYTRGDVAIADPTTQHRPVADPVEDCICLTVTEGSVRFTSPITRLLSPILRP
ncbi:MAG: ChrR family anti-sigma-E factor [Kiloniellales bacterium]|nr:ChrR family anti-sigma-E factor [Kiloniellales bacterium]